MNTYNLTDIHIHLIPGVDDGADSFETALSMVKCAYNEGIRNIIATPHSAAFDDRKNPVKPVWDQLKELVRSCLPDINLMSGAEILVERSEIKKIIRKLKHNKYPTMNNTSYVLTELPLSSESFDDAKYCILKVIDAGYTPIIAHAERYLLSVDQIYDLKEMGSLIQVNYSDIIPREYYAMTQKAAQMLKDEMIDFLSTDAHNISYRKPIISDALNYLEKHCNYDYIEQVFYKNPSLLM